MTSSRWILIVRLLLGVVLLLFGLNKFFMFMPAFELTGKAQAFFNGLHQSGYMFPLIGLVEVLAGFALLSNRYVALALAIMAPVTVNFLLFHLFLDLSTNIAAGLLVGALQLYLMFAFIHAYRPMLSARSTQ